MVRYGTPRRKAPRRGSTCRWKRMYKGVRKRTKGRARPSRSLRTSYRGTPNQYRFVRETVPFTLDVANPGHNVTILAGVGSSPNMSMLSFQSFEMDQLSDFNEFSPLFTSFKLDRLELICQPMWQSMAQPYADEVAGTTPPSAYTIPNLAITRTSTKFVLNNPVPSDADDARALLAQVQMKTRTNYGSRKPLKLITNSPRVSQEVLQGVGANVNIASKRPGWLNLELSSDQRFLTNDRIYCERIDGNSFPPSTIPQTPSVYLYRCYFKAHFRVSRVK